MSVALILYKFICNNSRITIVKKLKIKKLFTVVSYGFN